MFARQNRCKGRKGGKTERFSLVAISGVEDETCAVQYLYVCFSSLEFVNLAICSIYIYICMYIFWRTKSLAFWSVQFVLLLATMFDPNKLTWQQPIDSHRCLTANIILCNESNGMLQSYLLSLSILNTPCVYNNATRC